jgi:hypothetical protein
MVIINKCGRTCSSKVSDASRAPRSTCFRAQWALMPYTRGGWVPAALMPPTFSVPALSIIFVAIPVTHITRTSVHPTNHFCLLPVQSLISSDGIIRVSTMYHPSCISSTCVWWITTPGVFLLPALFFHTWRLGPGCVDSLLRYVLSSPYLLGHITKGFGPRFRPWLVNLSHLLL